MKLIGVEPWDSVATGPLANSGKCSAAWQKSGPVEAVEAVSAIALTGFKKKNVQVRISWLIHAYSIYKWVD